VLWALVLAMRADAHTYGPLVRRRDEKFIVLTISFDSRARKLTCPTFPHTF